MLSEGTHRFASDLLLCLKGCTAMHQACNLAAVTNGATPIAQAFFLSSLLQHCCNVTVFNFSSMRHHHAIQSVCQGNRQRQMCFCFTSCSAYFWRTLVCMPCRSLSETPPAAALTLLRGMNKTSMRQIKNKSAWLNSQCKRLTAQAK